MVGLGSRYNRFSGTDFVADSVSSPPARAARGSHRSGYGIGNSYPVDGRGRRLGSRGRKIKQQEPYAVNLRRNFKVHLPPRVSAWVVPDVDGISC